MSKIRKTLLVYGVVSVIAAVLALLYLYPFHPTTLLGGVVWVGLCLPAAVLLELLGSLLLNQRVSHVINPDSSSISLGRVAYGLLALLFFFAIVGLIVWFGQAHFGEFLEANYSAKW